MGSGFKDFVRNLILLTSWVRIKFIQFQISAVQVNTVHEYCFKIK